MELTGKCKKDFDKWFYTGTHLYLADISRVEYTCLEVFFGHLSDSMQYGVYVDFFRQAKNEEAVKHIIYDFYENCIIGLTTKEAIEDAVKNANKSYNEKS